MSEENKPSVGIRAWGTTPTNNNRRQFDDDVPRLPFMRLEQGINTVRIVTGIGVYYQARWKDAPKSRSKFGERIRTSFPTYEDCPVKKYLGLDGRERYMVVVINRVDLKDPSKDELQLLDLSTLTAEQIETNLEIKNSRRDDDNKVTPRDFDISIKFDRNATKATGFYSVVADDVTPLSESDLALINDIGGQEVLDKILNRQLLCPKPETVMKRMKALGWDGTVQTKSEEKAPLEEPDEEDYSFQRPSEAGETDAAANA